MIEVQKKVGKSNYYLSSCVEMFSYKLPPELFSQMLFQNHFMKNLT